MARHARRRAGGRAKYRVMGSGLTDIIQTKLLMPRIRSHLVRRDRLIELLDAGMHCALTLLSAPAGYGKTTLLVDWLRARTSESGSTRAAVWIELEEADNDPVQFVRLLVDALHPLVSEIDTAALALTQGPQPIPL